MLIVWTNRLIAALVFVLGLAVFSFFLGNQKIKWLGIIPPLFYLPIAIKPLYQIFFFPFGFDVYSFLAVIFPFLWLPIVFMLAYYRRKDKVL